FYRRIPSVYYWWFGAVFFLGLTIIWLPSQCTLDYLESTEVTDELQGFPKVDQDKELEFREDQLWYRIGATEPFTGVAEAFHDNGEVRSRTKVRDGLAYGLIEVWDENGTLTGPKFKNEFGK
ncbi:MAG: hypothetical protein VX371_04740, partial [Verrucomicrobiota bacterium]|nr:hypothetical protein [Verrucomicrobiota bacterium]